MKSLQHRQVRQMIKPFPTLSVAFEMVKIAVLAKEKPEDIAQFIDQINTTKSTGKLTEVLLEYTKRGT